MKILLIDDHTLFREGMRFLLQGLQQDIEIVEAEDIAEATASLRSESVDLVLLDLNMPGLRRLDALFAIKEVAEAVPVVVLSGEESPQLIREAIESGAMGFIPKDASHEILMQALKLVIAGGVYLPVRAISDTESVKSQATVDDAPELDSLTPRQRDVLQGVVKGQSNKLIARELDVSEHTVKAHLSAVFKVLNAKNRTDAVYQAARLKLPLIESNRGGDTGAEGN